MSSKERSRAALFTLFGEIVVEDILYQQDAA